MINKLNAIGKITGGIALIGLVIPLVYYIPSAEASVIFQDNFDSGASSLWGNEVGDWTATGGVYYANVPSGAPNAHSSLPFNLTDFSVDVDINKVKDGGIWLRSQEKPGTDIGIIGVLLVTGGDFDQNGTGLYWHIVEDGMLHDGMYSPFYNRVDGLFVNGESNPHIRITVVGNTYSAFVDGSSTPATTLTTSAFSSGQVALYDYSTQTFDNVVINEVPEPSNILGAVTALGFGAFLKRQFNKKLKNDETSKDA